MDRFLGELAAAMDDRVRRIGEHAARTRPAWAVQALGDVPGDPARQAQWRERAARIGAYREMYGYDSAADAIGPEPARTSPEARADWHAAFAALGRVDGIDLRGLTDAQLQLRRSMYERETGWAPRHVGEPLRLARLQARTAWENATRAEHDAHAAADSGASERHRALAGMWRAMETKASNIASILAEAHDTRRQWEALTEPTRRVALAADHELRRRHPERAIPPLKTAEPKGTAAQPMPETGAPREDVWMQPTLDGGVHLPVASKAQAEAGREEPEVSRAQREVRGQQELGLTPDTVAEPIPDDVLRIRENARKIQASIDELRGTPQFAEEDEATYLGPGWGVLADRERDAILQPPKSEIRPAREVRQRVRERMADHEAEPA